tara:strand:- start:108 stop:431 length:324 start_codon:yes stop_codon:yes gene_type:complete
MKFLFTLLVTLFLAAPAWAVDVAMNTDGLLLFEPSDITINKGESVHFVNGMLPPHNIIVDGRIDLSREALLFNPGQTQDIKFNEVGDYDFFCGHHHAAGMRGKIHVK